MTGADGILARLRAELDAWRGGSQLRTLLAAPTLTGAGVRVVLLDTGIDATALRRRAAERGQPAPILSSLAFPATGDAPAEASHGPSAAHGSTVADILLASAPRIDLVSVDIFGPRGRTEVETLAAALQWASAAGAKIVNVSLGVVEANLHPPARRQLLWRAVEEAYHRDVLVIAAAHNDHPQTQGYPALFAPSLVSVTKSASLERPLEYVGFKHIEFAATPTGAFGPFSTEPASSWAAPHAAAIAAKLLELEPTLKPFELKTLLYWLCEKNGQPESSHAK